MVNIPRGFPRVDNVASIRRGVAAVGQQAAQYRRIAGEEQALARGVEQLGATLTRAGAMVVQNQIRLDEKAQVELDKLEDDKRKATYAETTAAFINAESAVRDSARTEERNIDDNDWTDINAAVRESVGEDAYQNMVSDPVIAGRLQVMEARARSNATTYNLARESQEIKDTSYASAMAILREATSVADLQLLDTVELPGLPQESVERIKNIRADMEVDFRVGDRLDKVNEYLFAPGLSEDTRRKNATEYSQRVARSANESDAVKKQFAGEFTTELSRWNRDQANLNARDREDNRQRILEAAKDNLSVEQLDELWNSRDDADLGQGLNQSTYNAAQRLITLRMSAETSVRAVDDSIRNRTPLYGKDAQSNVNDAFRQSGREDLMNKPGALTRQELQVVTEVLNTGRAPAAFTRKLDISRVGPIDNTVRAYRLYAQAKDSLSMKSGLGEAGDANIAFYEGMDARVRGGLSVVEAAQLQQDFAAMSAQDKLRISDNYRKQDVDNAGAFDDLWNTYADEEADLEPLLGNVSDPTISARMYGLFDSRVSEMYSLTGDLEASQNAAFRGLVKKIGVSRVSNSAQLVTYPVEEMYGASTLALQADIVKTANAAGVPEDARLSLVPDSGTGRDLGYRLAYTNEFGHVNYARYDDGEMIRYEWVPPTQAELDEAQAILKREQRAWEGGYEFLMESQDPTRIYQNLGTDFTNKENYLERKLYEYQIGNIVERF